MASPDLDRVVKWFEERFESVSDITNFSHDCFNLVDDRLRLEGEPIDWPVLNEAASAWFKAAIELWELRGRPKSLRWRVRPKWENGHIYSRLSL